MEDILEWSGSEHEKCHFMLKDYIQVFAPFFVTDSFKVSFHGVQGIPPSDPMSCHKPTDPILVLLLRTSLQCLRYVHVLDYPFSSGEN